MPREGGRSLDLALWSPEDGVHTVDSFFDSLRGLNTLVQTAGSMEALDSSATLVWSTQGTGKTASFLRSIAFDALDEAKVRGGLPDSWAELKEDGQRRLELASDELGSWQRTWIAKGISEWQPPDLGKVLTVGSELPGPKRSEHSSFLHQLAHNAWGALDLCRHLVARHVAERTNPNRNGRARVHDIPVWLRDWLPEVMRALTWGLRKRTTAGVVAPKLGPQTAWTDVSTHAASLVQLVERLAHAIFPHAPNASRPYPFHLTIQGGAPIHTS